MYLPNTRFFIIATAFLIINLLAIGAYRWNASDPQDETVEIKVHPISLPYITDEGTQLSANGIPRGTFSFPTNNDNDIDNIELTAILLDKKLSKKKNLIKTVLLVAGNFSPDTEFQLSDRFQPQIVVPAKIVGRISTNTSNTNSKSNFTFLFAPDLTSHKVSQLAIIELDNKIPITHLSIRKIAAKEAKWLHTKYVRTLKPLKPGFYRPNKEEGTITFRRYSTQYSPEIK